MSADRNPKSTENSQKENAARFIQLVDYLLMDSTCINTVHSQLLKTPEDFSFSVVVV